jgi:FKBP-type peptidyl-prolyl cis-trans isomerase SlyD
MSIEGRIEPNSFVSLECKLRDEAGEPLEGDDGSEDQVEYVHGYGMLVPGLETALFGLKAGDAREVLVLPASGYGDRDEELMMEVDRSEFPDPEKVTKGDEFVAEFPDGENQAMLVVEVREDSVIVDANHPLAGKTLRYFVKVKLVRPATEEEIEQAARELEESEEGGHLCGPACSHEDDHEGHDHEGHDHANGESSHGAELITLGRRKSAPN